MKLHSILSLLFIAFCALNSQPPSTQEQPKLIIGIVVDQMRYDYLYKYWDDYGDRGFKRLIQEGYVLHDGHYQYAPTFTGPGHASIYTGTSPNVHGIIANDWYDPIGKEYVNCTGDNDANTVGSESFNGKMSPHRLLSTTLIDQLELATNHRAKTIGISIKDRGAILPAGHHPDGAYWYDKTNGTFITSDYYCEKLPDWVSAFNERRLVDEYMAQTWNTLLPLDRYDESLPDDKPFERPFINTADNTFPYDLEKISTLVRFGIKNTPYNLLPATPFGNTLLTEFAKTVIDAEDMGSDQIPDFLTMSFSSTDYAGHQFGNFSVEVQDVYLRLDKDLGEFFDYLDQKIGLNNILIFLSADHGATDVAGLVSPPGGYFRANGFETALKHQLKELTGKDVVENISNQQIYLVKDENIDYRQVIEFIKNFTIKFPGAKEAIELNDFSKCIEDQRICDLIRNGIMPGRSGDLYVQLQPGWVSESYIKGGTTHGSTYPQDTHVPILFYGWQIKHGDNYRRNYIRDIAPTISAILKIARPSGATGLVIEDLLNK